MPNTANHKVMIQDFPRCCGAFIIHTFDTRYTPKNLKDYHSNVNPLGTQQEFETYVKKNCETPEEYQNRITSQVNYWIATYKDRKSYFLAITNEVEKKHGTEEILKDLGFEVVIPETRNPTGTKITTWVYHLLPKEKDKKESIFKKRA